MKKYSHSATLKIVNTGLISLAALILALIPASPAGAADPGFSPWDLALIIPNKVNQATLNGMLSFADLGYSEAEAKAMVDHTTQSFILPESLTADADGISSIINGKKVLGGPLNDRVTHNAVNPPSPLRVTDATGEDATSCLRDVHSWRAEQMRIAPFKIQPPGTPGVYAKWAAQNKQAIDRIIQLRIAFRPYCKSGDTFEALPDAIHFAFELRPDDPQLMKDSKFSQVVNNPSSLGSLTSAIWGNAGTFANASRQGNKGAAMPALLSHLGALNSKDYNQFRRYVFADIARFSTLRRSAAPTSNFKTLNETSEELRSRLVFSDQIAMNPETRSFANPAFQSSEQGAALLSQFKTFATKYATKHNATAIAGFLTEEVNGKSTSFYSNLGLGAYGGAQALKDPGAKADYSMIHPNSMSTTVAEIQDNGAFIKLSSGKTADFYAQADAIGDAKGFSFRLLDPNVSPALISGIDFYSKNSVQNDGHGNQEVIYSANFPDHDAALFVELDKYSDPNRTLPSSTSCVSCHTLPRSGLTGAGTNSVRLLQPSIPKFILLDERSLTSRSVRELDREFVKLNLEWFQSNKTRCEDVKALRDCLDTKDAKTCIDENCK